MCEITASLEATAMDEVCEEELNAVAGGMLQVIVLGMAACAAYDFACGAYTALTD